MRIKPKKGMLFWEAYIYDDGEFGWSEWIVTSIQNRKLKVEFSWQDAPRETNAYLVNKAKGFTWIKRSKKHFDWGWAPNIPDWMKKKKRVGEDGKISIGYLGTTKLQAALRYKALLADSMARAKKSLLDDRWVEFEQETLEEIEQDKKDLKRMERIIASLRKRSRKTVKCPKKK